MVFRGVPPRREFRDFSTTVFDFTVGPLCFSPSVQQALDVDQDGEEFDNPVSRFLRIFNGDGRSGRPEHYCCNVGEAGELVPCHSSLAHAKEDMVEMTIDFVVHMVWQRMAEDTKKWCEVTQEVALFSFLG